MNNFLVGFFSGAISGALVAYFVELWTRRRLHGEAKRLKGTWVAHNMLDGRTVDRSRPMENTWATVMTPKPWWLSCAANSHVLDVSGDHVSDDGRLRHMEGYLTIDRVSPRLATRIVCYTDSDEVSEQRIVISSDGETLHVFPIVPLSKPAISYDRHALCRRPEGLSQS
jgi:hypothetical protein